MSNSRETLKQFAPSNDELEKMLSEALGGAETVTDEEYDNSIRDFKRSSIVHGKVVRQINDDIFVDIGYKSEGVIDVHEFGDEVPVAGDEVEVFLEEVEDEQGNVVLSKKRADRIRGWEKVVKENKEGDIVRGIGMRKIKGGLLVDIGIPVFLPASQVSLRRTADVSSYIGKEVEASIIKIDESRMNIVISRRKLLEEGRDKLKQELLSDLTEGQLRVGVVKNIADFGAFVDLGGIDGLLHITDMSWGRIAHPSEMLSIDDEVEVKILKFDEHSERIALGLKQKTESPWQKIGARYEPGQRINGEIVNVMSYGAFVKLEEGVEGLVHISEMSWTRRVNHPSELVNIGDVVEVVVLSVNPNKQEISLGMKQIEANPWTLVAERYPIGTIIRGNVRNLTNYGAFIEIEEGIDGLLHVSDMSWTKKVSHPSETVKKGDEIEAIVLSVDQEKKRVALGVKQLSDDPWDSDIPNKFRIGEDLEGVVTKITSFGVFVEIEDELEGLMHISELSDSKVEDPEEIVKVGDKVHVRIIKVNTEDRKIGLSLMDVIESVGGSAPAKATDETEEDSDEALDSSAAEVEEAPAEETEAAVEPEVEEAPDEEAEEDAEEAPAAEAEEAPDAEGEEATEEEAPAAQVEEAPAEETDEAASDDSSEEDSEDETPSDEEKTD